MHFLSVLPDTQIPEVGDVAIAITTPFDELHPVVDTLYCAISNPLVEIVQNGIPPTLECLDEGDMMQMVMKSILFCALLGLLTAVVIAAEYYASPAVGGNGRSQNSPFRIAPKDEKKEAIMENMDSDNKDKNQSVTGSARHYNWKSIGEYGCYGVPDGHQDPNNPDVYIIIWQRYTDRPAGHQVEDVKFAIYNARTSTFSSERYVFDPRNMTIMQGHPCWGYSHGKYRIFYCQKSEQGDFVAEVTADNWSDFQKYEVSNSEPVVTPDLGGRPFQVFLPLDDSTAWLFYLDWWRKNPDVLIYTTYDKDKGWGKREHSIPTSTFVEKYKWMALGSALKVGNDIVLYASVCRGSEYAGRGYRLKTSDRGKTWTTDELVVSGISEPFKKSPDGQLWTRVVRKGDTYYLSSQSDTSHRWLAKGKDGVHFNLVADFGERRSLNNVMINIEGTRDILLVYANYPTNLGTTEAPGVEKDIEYLIYDTGESD